MTLILASQSVSRRAMLSAAGVPYSVMPSYVDENAAKSLLADLSPRGIAGALAEMKAIRVSTSEPGKLVLGSDSIVALADGKMLDKPRDRAEAADHLRRMRGSVHDIWSAAVIVEDGRAVWRRAERAAMHVRAFSDRFLESYLDAEWPAIAGCVGCYRIEALGAQLFERIEGSHFTVLGLPLLSVLDYLRERAVITI